MSVRMGNLWNVTDQKEPRVKCVVGCNINFLLLESFVGSGDKSYVTKKRVTLTQLS